MLILAFICFGIFIYIYKSADLEDNFCSSVLRLSEVPKFGERPETAVCCIE